jgi:hypothetical protein
MLKVGIFTPYVRNEVTLAATQFADWLVRCGIDVVMLSSGKIESGIHRHWDRKVRRAKKSAVYQWAYGATHLCWFEEGTDALKWSRLVTTNNPRINTKHYYFPHWTRQTETCRQFISQVDRVVCLNRDIYCWLRNLDGMDIEWLGRRTTHVNLLSPSNTLLARDGKITKGQTRLLAVLTKATKQDLGPGVLNVFESLLKKNTDLSITVLLESSLPRSYRRRLSQLRRQYGTRLEVVSQLPYYSYPDLARQHDWVYIANVKHLFGSLLSALSSSSTTLICHDLPPVGSFIRNRNDGVLIPCNLRDATIPRADVDQDVIFKYLDCVVNEPEVSLMALQLTGAEYARKRQDCFEQFIYREFV